MRNPVRHAVAMVLVMVLVVAVAHTAWASADETGRAERAHALLADGGRLVDVGDYEGARAQFQAAYDVVPSWQALSGIALTYDQQGDYLEALETYERLLREFHAALDPEHAATAALCIAELEARIGVLALEAPQLGPEVVVDGVNIGRGPLAREIRVMPGSHTVVVTLDGHVPLTTAVTVTAGGTERVVLRLVAQEVRLVVKTAPLRLERPMPTWVPWATLGGGLAALALGGGLLYAADRKYDAFNELVNEGETGRQVLVDDRGLHTAERLRTAAITSLTVSGAAAVTGVVLMILNRPSVVADDAADGRRARIVPVLGGAGLEVSF
jgi:tetratricopeptide (TPR) repeat protein